MAPSHLGDRATLENRIRGEYNEMPGLRLTPAQARRLWDLDSTTCQNLIDDLIQAGFLRRTRDGALVRCDRRFVAA